MDFNKRVLISGGGIAGLTLAALLFDRKWEPTVIEVAPRPRTEGHMMDFYGSGWDVAERLGIAEELRAIRYPVQRMEYVDRDGRPYISIPVARVRRALHDRYVPLRRADLEQVLLGLTARRGLKVRYSESVEQMTDTGSAVDVVFKSGKAESFAFVFGCDGVHSRVRELVFGPEVLFQRSLGYFMAAFAVPGRYGIDDALKMYEEPDRVSYFYPLDDQTMDATYVFRSRADRPAPGAARLGLLKDCYRGAGWISEQVLLDLPPAAPLFVDTMTQINLPKWTKGRVALLGDACGALTLMAGQGSHMAMAGAYVMADQLERHRDGHQTAFGAYETFMKPAVASRQRMAVWLSHRFAPSRRTRFWFRRTVMRVAFSAPVLRWGLARFGSRSILEKYPPA